MGLHLTANRSVGTMIGVALIGSGIAIAANPLVSISHRAAKDASDNSAAADFQAKGLALRGAAKTPSGVAIPTPAGPPPCSGATAPPDAYALVQFASLPQYGYVGIAGDGDWGSLVNRSMVHWHGSPAPGQQGNVIVAFHREPNYEHIDQLDVGGTVTLTDRACHSFTYRVVQRWELAPEKVSQLSPTSGHDLTLITCTPWWQDYHRFVWRATLV